MTGFTSLSFDSYSPGDATASLSDARILGPQWIKLPMLTLGFLGVQVLWSVEMSYASPYLLSLGLSKSLMAIVFLAGPVSGLIVQPLIGILADNSKSRFGRRRPYMIGGAILTASATLLLGYTRPVSGIFTQENSSANNLLTIWLAVLAIYVIDFSINAVQAVDRALVVDILPTPLQPAGNAWAAKMLGVGSVIGFFVGNIDLPKMFPIFGSMEIEVLSVISTVFVLVTHSISAWCVKEKPSLDSPHSPRSEKKTFRNELSGIWHDALTLPKTIKTICMIQFFAWIGWFPVLFYTTVYIGDIYKSNLLISPDGDTLADAEGTRLGARALFYSSCISLVSNFVLPLFITKPAPNRNVVGLVGGGEGISAFEAFMSKFRIGLPMLWATSHAIFAACMFATFFVSTVRGASILIAVTGFSWAITQWAPFSLLGEAILSHSLTVDEDVGEGIRLADARADSQIFVAPEDDDDDDRVVPSGEEERQHLVNSPDLEDYVEVSAVKDDLSAKAGSILGLHNIFIVIPQFLVTGLASIIFAVLDPNKSVIHAGPATTTEGETNPIITRDDESKGGNSVAIIFRIGGFAAAVAFVLALRLARDLKGR